MLCRLVLRSLGHVCVGAVVSIVVPACWGEAPTTPTPVPRVASDDDSPAGEPKPSHGFDDGTAAATAVAGQAADYSVFKVYAFQWRDEHGAANARGNHYPIGRVPWWLELGGLTASEGEHRVGIKTRIRNVEGMVMYESPDFNIKTLPVDPALPRRAEIADSAQIPASGKFRLEFDLRNEATREVITHGEIVFID